MTVAVAFLKSIPYFSKLSPDELSLIQKLIFETKVEKGDTVVLEGEPPGHLYFVSAGVMKMFRTSLDGKEQVLKIVRPGESFNDVSIFDGGPNLASVQAMVPGTICGISRADLHAFLKNHPQMALDVINVLASQLRQLVLLVDDLSFKPVVGRLARILLERAGDGVGAGQRLTQQDMAAIAGTGREVIGRSLKALETEGVIRIDRHRIIITDRKALEELAGVSS
jgi:CRP-like cAMP-binding protein